MANANIFQQYLQPVKSVQDYTDEANRSAMGQLQLQTAQQQLADQNAIRALYAQGVDLSTPEGQAKLYAAAPNAAGPMLQQRAAIAKDAAAAEMEKQHGKLFSSEADQKAFDLRTAKADKAIKDIAALSSPQEAVASLNQHLAAGDIDQAKYQAVLATIPQDPSKFSQWQIGMLKSIMAAKDQIALVQPDANAVLSSQTSKENTAANNQTQVKTTQIREAGETARSQARLSYEKSQPKGVIFQSDQGPMLADPRSAQTQPLIGPDGKPLGPKMKDIPQAVVSGYINNQSALQKIDDAIEAVKSNPDAFGATNYLGDAIKQRTDPGGVKARAIVSDLGSLKIHDRTGAAMSAAESVRLNPFIPKATDNPEAVLSKLEQMRAEYLDKNNGMETYYNGDLGYKPITSVSVPRKPSQAMTPAKTKAGATVSNW